jgi:hypothetical protein
MTETLAVINTQSFGDALLSTHIGRVAKMYKPDLKVHLFIREGTTLTTAESDKSALNEMLFLLSLQEGIESAGLLYPDGSMSPIYGKPTMLSPELKNPKTLLIQGWSSDLGIVRSQLKPFYDLYDIKDPINTETKFTLCKEKVKQDKLTVGIAGDLDFLRKWHNKDQYKRFLDQIYSKKYNIKIERFGVDVSKEGYYEQLLRLNNCDLLISPIGSLVHFAAGLGVDTISLTSVFPFHYDCPEFYHSGWHNSVKQIFPLHCIKYNCVTEKKYDNQQTWGNPPTKYGFWPENCEYTVNKKSCNYNITAEDLITKFEWWLNDKNS